MEVRVRGDVLYEPGFITTKVLIEESEIKELEGRKAFLKIYGIKELDSFYFALVGNVNVRNGHIYINTSREDIEFYEEGGIRKELIERYLRASEDFSQDVKALGLTFLFGEPREVLRSEVRQSFLSTGLVHLLVISGLHVGTLALIFRKILPANVSSLVALIGVSFYVWVIAPKEAPVLRAYLMFLFFVFTWISFRRPDPLAILFLSGSSILALLPHYVTSFSFWLSFLATLYIILALENTDGRAVKKTLLVSASAFTGTAPLISTFSFISPLSIVATPLIGPIVALFSFFGILALISFMSFSPFVSLFNLTGLVFLKTVSSAEHLSLKLFPQISLWEAVALSFTGALFLFILRGNLKILSLVGVNLYLIVRALV